MLHARCTLRAVGRFAPLNLRRYAVASQPQTRIEKIVQKYAVDNTGTKVKAGDYVMIRPDHVMTHDNTGPVISKFLSLSCSDINNPRQPVFTLDHDVQNKSETNIRKYQKIEAFAKQHGVDFYPAGRGIGHQIIVEEGYALPGKMVVASDSHSNHYGGVGCLGTAVVRTDAAGIWATGKFWWQIPRIVSVNLEGKLRHGVTGKDVIVALAGSFNRDEVLNAAIEFEGSGIEDLTVDERMSIANMTTEWGAVAGVFPLDQRLTDWYGQVIAKAERMTSHDRSLSSQLFEHPRLNAAVLSDAMKSSPEADRGALYSSRLSLNLTTLVPHISGPNSVKIATPLPDLAKQRIPINKAYLVSCTNSRASDIASAASVLRGKSIAPTVDFYVAAASSVVQQDAEAAGDWQALVEAGANVLPSGCGPCIGLGVGLLEKGETGISASNRNYKGRMGHPEALAYLGSPAVVAASALNGYICGPEDTPLESIRPDFGVSEVSQHSSSETSPSGPISVLKGFPQYFEGPLVFVPQDNLTTDAMYPGKYTYQDDITPERQAEVAMENYDAHFASIAKSLRKTSLSGQTSSKHQGTMLVSGYNFGTGSSREQAATALKNAGISLVIGGSFGDIYKRNAINNGLILVECEPLVAFLTQIFGRGGVRGEGGPGGELTIVPDGWRIEVDVANSLVRLGGGPGGEEVYPCATVGSSVQEIWTHGGLEGFIRASSALKEAGP